LTFQRSFGPSGRNRHHSIFAHDAALAFPIQAAGRFCAEINPDLLGIYHPFFPEHEHFSEIL